MYAPYRVLDLSFNPLGKWDNSPLVETEERLQGLKLEVRRHSYIRMKCCGPVICENTPMAIPAMLRDTYINPTYNSEGLYAAMSTNCRCWAYGRPGSGSSRPTTQDPSHTSGSARPGSTTPACSTSAFRWC